MRFRLVYEGPLPSGSRASPRKKEKHEIRKKLHPQLRELWRTHPQCRGVEPENVANEYQAYGFRWVPLVRKDAGMDCALDILFLRRDIPGGVVEKGGDIDNRIKVFLDALRMAENKSDVDGLSPTEDENPFYCLMQDDYLITELNITTDQFLKPCDSNSDQHHVLLVVNVRVSLASDSMWSVS